MDCCYVMEVIPSYRSELLPLLDQKWQPCLVHSYVCWRVHPHQIPWNHHFPIIFLWFSHFLMVFPWLSQLFESPQIRFREPSSNRQLSEELSTPPTTCCCNMTWSLQANSAFVRWGDAGRGRCEKWSKLSSIFLVNVNTSLMGHLQKIRERSICSMENSLILMEKWVLPSGQRLRNWW